MTRGHMGGHVYLNSGAEEGGGESLLMWRQCVPRLSKMTRPEEMKKQFQECEDQYAVCEEQYEGSVLHGSLR